ncbi:MAG: carboxypeptidase-like regulatory domain-containing protein, partial [Terriglobales bacterium]
MRRSNVAVRVALLIVSIVALTALVQAQYRTSIQGVVTDPTGAVVSGANLTLTNPATGEKQVRVSDASGVFNFNALAAADVNFRLEVEKTGFEKKVLDHLILIPDQPNGLNVRLDIGAASQTVNVDATSLPALETETASINGVVSDNQIQHLPSFGRDVMKLTQLAPGMFADGSQVANGQYNQPGTQSGPAPSGGAVGIFATENLVQGYSSGNQAQNTGIAIDGISTTSAVWGGSTVITPSEDSVEDVKIVTNSYDAEDGRFTGAQVQITSKSGSNDFHGSLFFTTHQPNLNAFQPYFGQPKGSSLRDNSKFNQFGGSVGGPIWKNKIFAFFSYETIREPNASPTGTGWYDTAAFDALAPAGSIASQYVAFPGNGVIGTLIGGANCGTAGLTEGVNCATIAGQGINLGTPLNPTLFPLGNITLGQDPGWANSQNPGTGGDGSGGPENLGTVADLAEYTTINPTTKTAVTYNGRLDADVTSKDRI